MLVRAAPAARTSYFGANMKIGLIGAGGVGSTRAGLVANTPDAKLVLVADALPDRAARLAGEHGAEAVTDWRQVAESPEVDTVIISASNDIHAPASIAALEAGKNVLCEKPLARTPDEARQVHAAAERTGLTLKTGFNHRHYPAVLRARDIADSGELGSILWMRCRYGHRGTFAIDKGWFVEPEISGGGTFLDNGVHVLDICRWFMGDFVEACGFAVNAYWRSIEPVEDNGFGLFRTAEGGVAQVHASWNQWEHIFSVEIFFERGAVTIDNSAHIRIARRGGEWGEIEIEERHFHEPDKDSWRLDWMEFLAAIEEDRQPLGNAYDGWKAVEMAHAVYTSSRERRFVALGGEPA